MKTAEQLKGAIRNIAKSNNLQAQEVLQIFMFERLIERLSVSSYNENFILKGGLLIASIIGVGERTTMDMDTTVKGISMEKEEVERIIIAIIEIDVGDGILFEYKGMNPIRKDDEYNNFSASIIAKYGKMYIPMKIDITTGDEITPREIEYSYKFMFEDKRVSIMAYPLETIIAEKYETVIRRNIGNTRSRDFYDLYMLYNLKKDVIAWELLGQAILATATKRASIEDLRDYIEIIDEIRVSNYLENNWINYQNANLYTEEVSFGDTLDIVKIIGDKTIETVVSTF